MVVVNLAQQSLLPAVVMVVVVMVVVLGLNFPKIQLEDSDEQ